MVTPSSEKDEKESGTCNIPLTASVEKTLIVLLGPTAVGKSGLGLRLARLLDVPVISADSRQIYRQLHIGTASPSPAELSAVKHYFVGTLNLDEYYSAARYEADVLSLLRQEYRQRDVALLVGGSMMYIDAVCQGIDDIPTVLPAVRRTLRQRLATEGLPSLLSQLRTLDPASYATVDRHNARRVVHALEICLQTGRPYSSFLGHARRPRPFRVLKIGLTRSREDLFRRINRRVDEMMEQGLLDEARALYPLRHLNSLNTVGYKELFRVFDGEWELPMAVERIKKNTRVYAKKQLTWFRRDDTIRWYNLDDYTDPQLPAEHILAQLSSPDK